MPRFSFYTEDGVGGECGICGELIARQSTPPELKYIQNKKTKLWVSVQLCKMCLRQELENERYEEQKARRKAAKPKRVSKA